MVIDLFSGPDYFSRYAIGFENGKKLISAQGINLPDWIQEIKDGDQFSFYKTENKSKSYYDITLKSHVIIPGQQDIIDFSLYDKTSLVYSNDELQLHDIGDGVLCVEFKSKYNAIGEGILRGLNESVKIAEEQGWKGIVIGNNANNFTVGANLMLIGMMAFQQEYDQLDMAVRLFQQTSMSLRNSAFPVVIAT